jgi:hypothetical protein
MDEGKVKEFVRVGRYLWKIENEVFNTLIPPWIRNVPTLQQIFSRDHLHGG